MGEDLYRKGKKPYVETEEVGDLPEEEAAQEAWNKHLLRNESIIHDLFHGQFKSTVSCNKCDRISVTFDPMMTISLPIPAPKKKISFFFVPYNVGDDYMNQQGNILLGQNDNFRAFRETVNETYGLDQGSYLISLVFNNQFTSLWNCNSKVEDNQEGQGVLLLYQIDPSLNPSLPV